MAEKLLKAKKQKIAAKKCTANGGADGVAGRAAIVPNGRAASTKPPKGKSLPKDEISLLAKSENREYYVFKTSFLDYGPKLEDPIVVARGAD